MDCTGDTMKKTNLELKNKKKYTGEHTEEKTLFLESTTTCEAQTQKQSTSLSRDLAFYLMNLIKQVNENGVTPDTVNASSNAAAQIYKILKLNLEMKRDGY